MTSGIVVDPVDPTAAAAPPAAAPPADDGLPEKFKGKSAKEIADAYSNLESEFGRVRNEIGEVRQEARTWRTLAEEVTKRPAPPKKPPVEISSDQILSDPTKAVRTVVTDTLEESLAPVKQETERLARMMEVADFVRDFPTYTETGNDPDFQKWVGSSNKRRSLAQRAVEASDVKSMRALMEDWEERRALISELKPQAQQPQQRQEAPSAPTGIAGARSVATERPGDSAPLPGGKTFTQDQVIKILLNDPDRYYSATFQAELNAAIEEGRYKQ